LEYNDILCAAANRIGNDAAVELLDGMTALKLLNLRGNRLQILPLGAMAGRLSSSDNKSSINMLSSTVFSLTALDLSANSLVALPQELGLLDQLLQLSVQRNRLTELPAEVGSLSLLQRLDVSNNLLSELPGCLGQLQALRSLDISCNPNLIQLPRSIIGLVQVYLLSFFALLIIASSKLLELRASRCSLSAFPETVTTLPKLTVGNNSTS
jgi:Leucine-rich repeat (LRR) protein